MYKLVWLVALVITHGSYVLAAERRALLVGVSDYPTLRSDLQLPGPRNDVNLLAAMLPQLGFESKNIMRLAGRPGQTNEPTRSRILSHLQAMVNQAAVGDTIFLYFAGHGSRQPSSGFGIKKTQTEALFLPSDIGAWDRRYGTVRNAMRGVEFATAIDAMRARGATVWTLFDSCHAATIVRGSDQGMRWRYVDPGELGVPLTLAQRTTTRGLAASALHTSGTNAGRWLAFYATQGAESTPELPFYENGSVSVHGLFTYTVAQAWLRDPSQSWHQLEERVRAAYAAQHRFYPTPLLEGTAIDETLNGNATEMRSWQWPLRRTSVVDEWEIDAGSLYGLEPGARFDVLSEPSASTAQRLGQMQLKRSTVFSSTLSTIGTVTVPEQAFARVVSTGTPAPLFLYVTELGSPAPAVRQALEKLRIKIPVGITLIPYGKPHGAQLALSAQGKQLQLAPIHANSSEGRITIPYSPSGEELYARLALALRRQLMAGRLHKIISEQSDSTLQAGLKIQILVARGKEWIPLEIKEQPKLHAGQRLLLRVTNQYRRAIDLTMLFLDSQYALQNVYPSTDGETNRIDPGSTVELPIMITVTTLGVEHLLAFALEALPGDDVADFRYLTNTFPGEVRGELDSAFGSSLDKILAEIGLASTARRGLSGRHRASLVSAYSWRTIP